MKNIIFLFCIIASISGCINDRKKNSLVGAWAVIENDSLYSEIIFTKDRYWSFSTIDGDAQGTYRQFGDSIEFINRFGVPFMKSQIRWINKDEFISYDLYFLKGFVY